MFNSTYLITLVGVIFVLANYIQLIIKNDPDSLADASYATWGLFSVALFTYFLGIVLGLFFMVEGTFAKIFELVVFLILAAGLINSIWFVILQGKHQNLKRFWGYLLNMVLAIKTGLMHGGSKYFILNMLDLVYIFLGAFFLNVLFCNLFTDYKNCDRATTGTKTEYTVWTLAYLLWFVLNSLNIRPIHWL